MTCPAILHCVARIRIQVENAAVDFVKDCLNTKKKLKLYQIDLQPPWVETSGLSVDAFICLSHGRHDLSGT